jgi:hypothetical protein
VREYRNASYPRSIEMWSIADAGLKAIGGPVGR